MIEWLMLAMAPLPQAAPDNPCAKPEACRRVESVRIETPDGREIKLPVQQTLPWVVQGNLLMVPGDSVTVRLVERDGALVPELVRAGPGTEKVALAEGEIRATIRPYVKGNVIMEIVSKRPETLDYVALIVGPAASGSAKRTSVCSLQPGIPVFESWNEPIRQFALSGFRKTTEPGCKTIDTKKAGTPSPTT